MSGEYLLLSAKRFLFTGRLCSSNNSEAVDLAALRRKNSTTTMFL